MKQLFSTCLAVVTAAVLAIPASAQEWTRFRGPNGTGIAESKEAPTKWTESDFLWRVPIPGQSHCQPVIWGDKLFVTTAENEGRSRMMMCLDKNTGKTLWTKKYEMDTHRKHGFNSFSSCTPVVDKDRVIACFVDPQKYLVKAWDHEGKELWSVNLGTFESQHGYGSSPMLYEDRVILTNDQIGESSLVALSAKTGRIMWKSPRKTGGRGATAYGVPCLFKRGNVAQLLLTSNNHGVSAVDPRSGRMLWEAPLFDKRSVASPVIAGGLVFGTCGSGAHNKNYVVAVKLGGRGNVSKSHLAYKFDKVDGKMAAPYVPTPLVLGDRVFLFEDKAGLVTCLQASTGKIVWNGQASQPNDGFFGSPVLVGKHLYCNTKKGETVVLEAGDKFNLVARNPLGEASYSTPCVDNGRLYMKTFSHLVCIGKK